MRETAPVATICGRRRRLRCVRDMPELRCCLFEWARLIFGVPRDEPWMGKKRFFVAECVLSLYKWAFGRGAASDMDVVDNTRDVGGAARRTLRRKALSSIVGQAARPSQRRGRPSSDSRDQQPHVSWV